MCAPVLQTLALSPQRHSRGREQGVGIQLAVTSARKMKKCPRQSEEEGGLCVASSRPLGGASRLALGLSPPGLLEGLASSPSSSGRCVLSVQGVGWGQAGSWRPDLGPPAHPHPQTWPPSFSLCRWRGLLPPVGWRALQGAPAWQPRSAWRGAGVQGWGPGQPMAEGPAGPPGQPGSRGGLVSPPDQRSDLHSVLAQGWASVTPRRPARMTKPEQAFYGHFFTTHNINHPGARRGGQEINEDPEPLPRAGLPGTGPGAHLTAAPRVPRWPSLTTAVCLGGGSADAGPTGWSHLPHHLHPVSAPVWGHEGGTCAPPGLRFAHP